MQLRITDVERLKKAARKTAAGQVLSGGSADVCLDLARMSGCQASIAAGYGQLGEKPQPIPQDRLIWVLDGYAEVHDASGQVTHVTSGESTHLRAGESYRFVFPQLTIYLRVEPQKGK
jgi:hypothetical protein